MARDNGSEGSAASLGSRVRMLRKDARMTLEQASAATGISRAALSRIERGEMSPTYDTLCKLAGGFKVDLALLVSGSPPHAGGVAVARAREGAVQATDRFVHRLLAPDFAGRAMYVFETEVIATSLDGYGPWDRHDSEDFLYGLEGTVAVHLEGKEPVLLGTGDAMQMDGRIAHALHAVASATGPAKARLLWVSVPRDRRRLDTDAP